MGNILSTRGGAACAVFFCLLLGCSEDPADTCDGPCSDASSPDTPVMMTTRKDSGFGALKPIPDGGIVDGWVPDLDLELQALIQVNGTNLPCGACSVVAAQAQGGRRPYTYQWSDPALQGPGPHKVCPTGPTALSVTLTDSSSGSGEFMMPSRTVTASAQLDCVADSGVALDTVGCVSGSSFEAPKDPPIQCAGGLDSGMLTDHGQVGVSEVSGPPPKPLIAGQTYEFIYDHLVPLVLGMGVTVEVYGAMADAPCEKLEKLFTFRLDGTWHQSLCFTPVRAYERIISHIQLDGVWFWFELGQIGTLCSGCPNN